jgi:hypothetical protein
LSPVLIPNQDGTINEVACNVALRRYRTMRAEQRAKPERDAPPPSKCSFCGEDHDPDKRRLFSFGSVDADGKVRPSFPFICEASTKKAATAFKRLRTENLIADKARA